MATFIAIANLILFVCYGISPGSDSPRYTRGAEFILQGISLEGGDPSYLGYILFIALFKSLSLGDGVIIIAQIFLQFAAMLAFNKIANELFGVRVAFISSSLFLISPHFYQWTRYILTESFFVSIMMLSIALLYSHRNKTIMSTVFSAIMFGYLGTIRPNGLVLCLFFTICHLPRAFSDSYKRLALFVLPVSFFLIFKMFGQSLGDSFKQSAMTHPYVEGHIIWGYKHLLIPFEKQLLREGSIETVLGCAFSQPVQFIKNFSLKIFFELSQVRPFYSLLHNLLNGILSLMLLFGVALSFGSHLNSVSKGIALLTFFQMAFIGITFADWDCRFFFYSQPSLTLLSAIGYERLLFKRRIIGI